MTSVMKSLYGDSTPARAALDQLWRDYVQMNPQIGQVVSALTDLGESFLNDHIALRTFDMAVSPDKDIGMLKLGKIWESWGYEPRGDYIFEVKGLRARHWEHPDPDLPRVFISELVTQKQPKIAQDAIAGLMSQLPDGFVDEPSCLWAGRRWGCDAQTWRQLADLSEYAGWLALFGLRANHFTVDVRSLSSFKDIRGLNTWLQEMGFALNDSGGQVKGSVDICLEQSSTLAAAVEVELDDQRVSAPGCYVEFAQRHHLPSGELFSGFVADNADKIFESTNRH
ncbi:MAG TPA: DUF1338 domain-containing protein [Myxococcales bacterium]|nr:succinyldiaminopimelate aminotransferase [Myxococcales bacterium]HAN32853.1 DUF1338 domain-containing protein [Myxococcales bacterium]